MLFQFLVSLISFRYANSVCVAMNNCNGHGRCNYASSTCDCYEGWGAKTVPALYYSPDCSLRTCPAGKAWGDIPKSSNQAHGLAECSNKGICDRTTGICACSPGFGGPSCSRMLCPNDCSGHGTCVSMADMAKLSRAQPLAPNTHYGVQSVSAFISV